MLISHIAEEKEKNEAYVDEIEMSKDDDISAQRNLLILYENDTKQTSVPMGNMHRMPNQYVENVVYKDEEESEDSDLSDIYRNEDLYDVVMFNKERIDLLDSVPSVEKGLRQKFGNIALHSGVQSNYHQHNLFKNQFVKSQYGSLGDISNCNAFDGALLSTCLLDFICYNQLDDNSNFYMDSIIQYAKRTIDQLKRISNGDYLTEKAKEQWKVLDRECKSKNDNQICKAVMAKNHAFYVESDKTRQFEKTLRGIVHSELDMRSLSKILQKQLFMGMPRLIRDSCRFFGKFCNNNVIIECKKVKQQGLDEKNKSRVDILIKLTPSKSEKRCNENISLLNSKQPLPCLENESLNPEEYNNLQESTNTTNIQNNVTVTEINECDIEGSGDNLKSNASYTVRPFKTESSDTANTNSSSLYISDISLSTDPTSNIDEQIFNTNEATMATTSCTMTPDDLFCSIQQFNTQTTLLEEIEDIPPIKKKSPTKVRIKSPYENKTFAIEERKRRKLLEIRERRERRKKALSENCKVTKHRYGKGAIMAQASNSVTKLSITNKSFYASIYGDNANIDNKHDNRQSVVSDICINKPVTEELVISKENKKFTHRSYYLDDPETEVMNLRNKPCSISNDRGFSTPSSTDMVNEIGKKLNSFVKLDKTSSSSCIERAAFDNKKFDSDSAPIYDSLPDSMIATASTSKSKNNTHMKKAQISLDCKKTIDKIYELMKRLNNVESESSFTKHEFSQSKDNQYQTTTQSFTIRATDSGTSVKHRLKSSNPSIYSFEDQNNTEVPLATTRRSGPEPNIISKVIISNKLQITSNYKETKPPKKVTIKPPANIPRNPLKAISHLINEFDNIQRNRQKPAADVNTKEHKKTNKSVAESKNVGRKMFLKRGPNMENVMKDVKPEIKKTYPVTDRKWLPRSPVKGGKVNNQTTNFERHVDKESKISDLIDDALREARGEAVKGPKLNPRLESLAQPKRFLIGQEESKLKQRKYSPLDRAPHLPLRSSQIPERTVVLPVPTRVRQKRHEMEYVSLSSKIPNYLQSTDKSMRIRRLSQAPNNVPTNNSPVQIFTRMSKKIMPNELYMKKRPLSLTQTAGSSNLLQRTHTPHVIPPENSFLQTKDSAMPFSNPVKKTVDIESRRLNNSSQDKALEPVQMITNPIKDPEENCENKPDSNAINEDEIISTSSDYVFDVLEDKDVLTAVETISRINEKCKEEEVEEINSDVSSSINTEQCNDITTEGIKNLEKALYRQLSQGIFLKRPKVKNLTLTPKQSSHKVFLLQCGDANSLLIKSCVSQNLHLDKSKCLATSSFELNFPLFPKSYVDRTFSRTSTTNIATIGYVFPNSRLIKCNPDTQNIPEQNPKLLITNHELKINANYEKGVQAFLLDNDGHKKYLDSNFKKEAIIYKIDKGTDWDTSCIGKDNGNSEESNYIKKESIDNTTSLDILTELIEEIEKITKYQSVVANNGEKEINSLCYTLSNCVCHNPINRSVNDKILTTPSFSVDGKVINVQSPKYLDKEVAVYITKESVNECTDAPSQLWFPKENCVPKSSNLIVSQRSSHSLVSLYDYRALYSNHFKEISDISIPYSKSKHYDDSISEYKKIARKAVVGLKYEENWEQQNLIKSDRKQYHDYVDQSDCNAILRMKRDILVTFYSILVFTVFAALSFPEILYNLY